VARAPVVRRIALVTAEHRREMRLGPEADLQCNVEHGHPCRFEQHLGARQTALHQKESRRDAGGGTKARREVGRRQPRGVRKVRERDDLIEMIVDERDGAPDSPAVERRRFAGFRRTRAGRQQRHFERARG